MIVRRPDVGVREVLDNGELDVGDGLVGDSWKQRGAARRTADGSPHPDMQLNVMNIARRGLVAQDPEPLAAGRRSAVRRSRSQRGNLPPARAWRSGRAVIEVTPSRTPAAASSSSASASTR